MPGATGRARPALSASLRAAIERAEAMEQLLEVASGCRCATTHECALVPQSGDDPLALEIISVPANGGCRRSVSS